MKQITKITASSLARVMAGCFGSGTHVVDYIDQGDAAKEGDAFHELLECKVKNKPFGTHATNGHVFDSDMHFYSDQLLRYIDPVSAVEIDANLDTRSGIKIVGRLDYSHVIEATNNLVITDVKYGWGLVDPENNWQLLAYAIAEHNRRSQIRQRKFDLITLRILQPRPHHERGSVREWTITYDQFLQYLELILSVTDEIAKGNTQLVTGSHCKYCPAARSGCVAINRATNNAIDVVVSQAIQDDLSDEELSYLLFTFERIKDIMKVKQDALIELAKHRIGKGKIIHNYMLKPSYTDRKWNSGVTAESIKMLTGIDIMKQDMMSPAQAEKAGVPKDLVKSLAKSETKGFNLVRGDAAMEANKIFNNNKGGQ